MESPTSTKVIVEPAARLSGLVTCPGDKSISHRYALIGALATGRTTVIRYAPGADCLSTLECLRSLGVKIRYQKGSGDTDSFVQIEGRGLSGLNETSEDLNAGNSGTTLRLLAGILAAHPFRSTITGDLSLCHRPMGRIIDPLRAMGAEIQAESNCPPVTILGGQLQGVVWNPTVPSAQVKSALLLAGLHATGQTTVREPTLTRDHTERALTFFGVEVTRAGLAVSISGNATPRARDVRVPGDFSSAAAWAVAAAGLPGSEIEIADVGLNPSRTVLLNVLQRAGAKVVSEVRSETNCEPSGRLTVAHRTLQPIVISPVEVPSLIDELPLLAALATHRGGGLTLTGASELRNKESDRITALVKGLRTLGANISEQSDGLTVTGDRTLTGGTVDPEADHRLVMAFAIAALGASGPSTILGADAVSVSYPTFFETLNSLRE